MITPQQARETYGFQECSSREDQMVLGLYHAAQGLFKSRFFLFLDYFMPFILFIWLAAVLAGVLAAKAAPMLILMPGAAAIMMIPPYVQQWKQRRANSGMRHLSKEMGDHFLIGYGVCAKKEAVPCRRFLETEKIYRLRVRFAKDLYLDDVRIMKELYEQVGEGARVCLMMADSPKAKQVIAAPVHFTEKVMDQKIGAVQQFERLNPRRLRSLDADEREYYIRQYQKHMEEWNGNYGKKYRAGAALFLAGGFLFLFLASRSMTILCWMMMVCALFALYSQKREFHSHLSYMQNTEHLEAVDVTVRREQGYTPDMGTEKRSNSMVHFVDAGGLVLWSLRTAEDLRRFRQGDKAILIIHDKIMLPFHRRNGA